MPALLSFNIYFITADNHAFPLQFIQDSNIPSQGTLTVNQESSIKPTVFILDNNPEFLQRNNGFYLGATYRPKIQLGSQKYYLSLIGNGSYALKLMSDDHTFAFSLLNPKINWETPDAIANFHIENLSIHSQVPIVGYYFYHQPPFNNPQQLTFSPIDCNDSINFCGTEICPENFVAVNSKCKSLQSTGIPFGIRTNKGVYTYKILNGKLIAAVAHAAIITSGIETNDTVRDRWFFVDPFPENNKLVIGKSYPIYVMINGKKFYLENPSISSNIITYKLNSTPGPQSAKFTPTQIIIPRSTVSSNQFQNFIIPNEDSFILWLYEDDPVTSSIGNIAVNIENTVSNVKNTASNVKNTASQVENAISTVINHPINKNNINSQNNQNNGNNAINTINGTNSINGTNGNSGNNINNGSNGINGNSPTGTNGNNPTGTNVNNSPIGTNGNNCSTGINGNNGNTQIANTNINPNVIAQEYRKPANDQSTSSSLWKTWWFWVSLIGIIIVIIVAGWGIYYLIQRDRTTTIKTGTRNSKEIVRNTSMNKVRSLPKPQISSNGV